MHPNDLTTDEKRKAMESSMFLSEKRVKSTKGRMHANRSTQRSYVPKEEASSPKVTAESFQITTVIEAKQERDVMRMGITNTFVQTEVIQGDETIIMNIRGALIDMLLEIDPENTKTS